MQFFKDKAPVVSGHTSRGIDFLERYGSFLKERASIEEEYSARIKYDPFLFIFYNVYLI